jgi:hypothetical protein
MKRSVVAVWGGLVLLGLVLGFYVHINWLMLSAVTGADILLGALTGRSLVAGVLQRFGGGR